MKSIYVDLRYAYVMFHFCEFVDLFLEKKQFTR